MHAHTHKHTCAQPLINFVGHFESLAADAQRLLQSLPTGHAWERYGATGWSSNGKGNDASMFATQPTVRHATNARARIAQYFNDSATRQAVWPLLQREFQERKHIFFGQNENDSLLSSLLLNVTDKM